MNKSFSIIIPTYNSEKYIEKCINSLLNQNYDKSLIQILVIDDGSQDNLIEIMKKYKNISSVEYHHKNNGQWGSVINYVKNNKLVKHDFVSILDADDFLNINAYKIINKNIGGADIFVGSFKKWDGNKEHKKIMPYWFLFKKIITNHQQMNSPFCLPLTYFVKSSIFYKCKDLTENIPYQDTDIISQFIKNSNIMKFTKKTIGYYYFNRDGNSISQKWDDKRFFAELNAAQKCIRNDAQEIVAYRLFGIKNFANMCKQKNIKFNINRKMKFKWFPWYARMIYIIIFKCKYQKFFVKKN